jgi:hypothetical protein
MEVSLFLFIFLSMKVDFRQVIERKRENILLVPFGSRLLHSGIRPLKIMSADGLQESDTSSWNRSTGPGVGYLLCFPVFPEAHA